MASQQSDSLDAQSRARALVAAVRERLAPQAAARTTAVAARLEKVLDAFAAERVGTQHFASLTGYGHGDQGREVLDRVFARVLGAEKAAVGFSSSAAPMPSQQPCLVCCALVIGCCPSPGALITRG